MPTPEPLPTDEEHEAAFIAAIQDDATNADIDNFLAIHQQVVNAAECGTPCEQ